MKKQTKAVYYLDYYHFNNMVEFKCVSEDPASVLKSALQAHIDFRKDQIINEMNNIKSSEFQNMYDEIRIYKVVNNKIEKLAEIDGTPIELFLGLKHIIKALI